MVSFFHKHMAPNVCLPFIGKCEGLDNIPTDEGVIIAPNHASYLDHFIVGGKVIRKMDKMTYFLAKKEHFDTFFQRQWHKILKAIPVDRQKGGDEALFDAVKHLNDGDIIVIYPEGTRTLDGKLNRGKTGVARLALLAKAPIVPVGLTNTFKILPKGKLVPNFRMKCDVKFGKPMYFKEYYDKEITKEILRTITTKVMKEIARLSDQEYDLD